MEATVQEAFALGQGQDVSGSIGACKLFVKV